MPLPPGDRELVQIMDAALADAALRAGPWLACRPGCTQCCHGAFAIHTLDAERLRAGMATLRREQPALATAIELRTRLWLDEHRSSFPGDPQTGLLGSSENDKARFEDFANDAPCPALNPASSLCDVYPWRPMTCRVFGPPVRMDAAEDDVQALACCELCFVGASEAEIAVCEMQPPHQLENRLLAECEASSKTSPTGHTIVAFALLP